MTNNNPPLCVRSVSLHLPASSSSLPPLPPRPHPYQRFGGARQFPCSSEDFYPQQPQLPPHARINIPYFPHRAHYLSSRSLPHLQAADRSGTARRDAVEGCVLEEGEEEVDCDLEDAEDVESSIARCDGLCRDRVFVDHWGPRDERQTQWIANRGKSAGALGRRERLLQRSNTMQASSGLSLRNMSELRKVLESVFETDPMYSLEKAAFLQGSHCPGMKRLATSWRVEIVIMIIILFFCIAVWIETSLGNAYYWGQDKIIDVSGWVTVQYYIMGLFVVEILSKMLILRTAFFKDTYNCIDLGISFLSIIPFSICISLPRYGPDSTSTAAWRKLLILRIIRVMRLAQVLRYNSMFRELWVLIRGITRSLKVLVWGMVLMTLMIYIFAVFATTMIGASVDFREVGDVQEQWGTVVTSMIGLFQIMTLDDWMTLIQPILDKQKALIIFFILFIMMSVFALTNLMTAVIVESALNIAREDELESDFVNRLKCKQMQKGLEEFTGKEALTKEEYQHLAEEPIFRRLMRIYDCDRTDVEILCELLSETTIDDRPSSGRDMATRDSTAASSTTELDSVDDTLSGNNTVRIEHFIVGMQKLKGWAKSKDLLEALNRLTYLEESQQHLLLQMERFGRSVKTSHSVIIANLLNTASSRVAVTRSATDSALDRGGSVVKQGQALSECGSRGTKTPPQEQIQGPLCASPAESTTSHPSLPVVLDDELSDNLGIPDD
eukprot:GHVQ01038525.1.p1 GENE.GHVQ01038525.1~~GHVQ01038525.1.p1  ORF type:complete len:724 (+),score=94.92 GHVQ01038525.1:101-2272(+)